MATAVEGYARAIASQFGLSSPIGQFVLHVASKLASIQSGGAAAPQYYEAKNLNPQNIGGVTNFHFDTVIAARGISQPDNESFQLTVGKTYHLMFHGRADSFNGVTDSIDFRWVDNNLNNIPLVDAVKGVMRPATSTSASSDMDFVDCIYTVPPGGDVVHVRVDQVSGSCVIPGSGVQVTIIEIPG